MSTAVETPPHAAAARPAPDPYAHKWMIALGVTLASVIELIDTSIVNVALTDLSASLGASIDEITWITVGYILASVIVLPMTGWLSQYFGRRRYFLGSIAIFTAASFFCGASHTLNELIVWRIVQGLGGGALISTSQAILFESFPRNEQTLAAAVFGIGMMIGPAIGPTLGGIIVDRYEWPWIFYINLPVGVLAFMMVSAYVKEAPYRVKPKEIDFVGLALLAIGIGSLQFVLERGEHYDWFDSRLITALSITSVVALVTMVWWELRVDEPILNLRVLKDRSLASGSAAAVVLGMALYGSIFAVPLLMQGILRFDAETTGWLLFPGALGSALAMAMIGRIGNRVDPRIFVFCGACILAGSMVAHSHFTAETSRHGFLWPIFFRGAGTGMMFVPLSSTSMAGLRGPDMPQGAAIFNLTRQIGGSVGIALLTLQLTRYTAQNTAVLSSHVSMYDPATQQRMAMLTAAMRARGADSLTAVQQAVALIARTIQGQAMTIAYERIFQVVAMMVLCTLPLVLLLKRPKGAMQMGGGH
jgi:DHA2 family multidrug resistance protein